MSSPTDIVSIAGLHLAATVGPDHWHRTRPQPIDLTIDLHLAPAYLDTSARSDDVADSLHYGHLAKVVEQRVTARAGAVARAGSGYPSARALVEDVTEAAFRFARGVDADADADADTPQDDQRASTTPTTATCDTVRAVRVVLGLPKYILLAGRFEIELTTRAMGTVGSVSLPAGGSGSRSRSGSMSKAGAIVRIADLILPVLIGVNPPERLAKQRVLTHLTFYEAPRNSNGNSNSNRDDSTTDPDAIDYAAVVQQIVTEVERTSHRTLERLVCDVLCTAYRALDDLTNARVGVGAGDGVGVGVASSAGSVVIDAITARCEKPSALSFADASAVEMTRTREALRRAGGWGE